MERLTGEARDRVRAMSLWLVAALVLTGVVVTAFATFVGFVQVSPTGIDRVVVADETSREVVVHYRGGSGCDALDRIEVTESPGEVELRAFNRARRPLQGRDCRAIDSVGSAVVELAEPLGGRVVRDRGREVPVIGDPQRADR